MSNTNIEKMKQLIEDKKKKSSQQGSKTGSSYKSSGNFNKGFKSTRKTGSLNK